MTKTITFLKHIAALILVFGISTFSAVQSADRDPKPGSEWIDEAIALEKSKDWSGLAKHASAWTEARPSDQFSWYSLYVAFERQDDSSGAINSVSRSIRERPELLPFWMRLSDQSIEKNENYDAVNISSAILKVVDSMPALKNLGYGQMRTGRYIEAAQSLEKYVEFDPSDKRAFLYLGLIYDNSREYDSAIDYFRRALNSDPDYASAWYYLAYTYHKLDGDNDRATEAYDKLKKLDPERASELASLIRLKEPSALSPSKDTSRSRALEAFGQALSTPRQRSAPQQSICNCKGYAGPGGPCYNGPGGAAYDGPGGPAYRGAGGACYAGPGGPEYDGPGGPAYKGPGGARYDGPGGPAYDGPGGPAYSGPGGACYAGPGGPCYSGPGGTGTTCPAICK